MSIVDKSMAGQGVRQFHIGVAPGEVSTVALMPGDPFRVPLVAEYLTDAVEVAHKREHRTMVGSYKGRDVTVTSTGVGCPSTAIAVEELARVGVTSFIRVGSTGALQPGIEPGDLIVSQGSFRNDGTTDMYVPKGYPAVPDLELTLALERAARVHGPRHGLAVHAGLNVTDDAFYAESQAWTEQMSGLGLLNVEMESSAMYVVARQRGLRAGMICAVSSNLVAGTSVYDEEAHRRLALGWGASIEAALDAIVELGL
ncbi:MAG TPA: nucleoside phosphorylase [Candidatus Limnocylindrales bacterium]|nr:nucleoside phosphorylase [Candidatus Limnocylindrales bacterium]